RTSRPAVRRPRARRGAAFRPTANSGRHRIAGRVPAARCRSPPAGSARSRPEGGARLAAFLVQLAIEMEAFEDKLHRCREPGGIAGRTELCNGAFHPGDLKRLLPILLA